MCAANQIEKGCTFKLLHSSANYQESFPLTFLCLWAIMSGNCLKQKFLGRRHNGSRSALLPFLFACYFWLRLILIPVSLQIIKILQDLCQISIYHGLKDNRAYQKFWSFHLYSKPSFTIVAISLFSTSFFSNKNGKTKWKAHDLTAVVTNIDYTVKSSNFTRCGHHPQN